MANVPRDIGMPFARGKIIKKTTELAIADPVVFCYPHDVELVYTGKQSSKNNLLTYVLVNHKYTIDFLHLIIYNLVNRKLAFERW